MAASTLRASMVSACLSSLRSPTTIADCAHELQLAAGELQQRVRTGTRSRPSRRRSLTSRRPSIGWPPACVKTAQAVEEWAGETRRITTRARSRRMPARCAGTSSTSRTDYEGRRTHALTRAGGPASCCASSRPTSTDARRGESETRPRCSQRRRRMQHRPMATASRSTTHDVSDAMARCTPRATPARSPAHRLPSAHRSPENRCTSPSPDPACADESRSVNSDR